MCLHPTLLSPRIVACAGVTLRADDAMVLLLTFVSKLKSLFVSRPREPPLISVVLQFRKPIPLPDEVLHAAITRAWGRDIREDLNEHIVNGASISIVKFDGMVLSLSNGGKPYCPAEYLERA